jgi:hypothetical protein
MAWSTGELVQYRTCDLVKRGLAMAESHWRLPDRPDLGAMNVLSGLVRNHESTDALALPNLRLGSTIIIGSDYSGQHATSHYEAFSFVFADISRCAGWFLARRQIRDEALKDGRRFSYKALRDRKRAGLLPSFLDAANRVHGLLVVVLVPKSIDSLFKSTGSIKSDDEEIASLAHWSPRVVEKLLRVAHFVSLFLAALSRPSQNVVWITDEDEIAANADKHHELTTAFGKICSHYLDHNLAHVRVATTASDTGKRDVEDFVSIADFAAGALCEVLNAFHRDDTAPVPGVVVPVPMKTNAKAIDISRWFAEYSGTLKRLVLAIEPQAGSQKLSFRLIKFQKID